MERLYSLAGRAYGVVQDFMVHSQRIFPIRQL